MSKKKYGSVYEINLPNGKYAYICWIAQFSFGVFDCISDKPTELDRLLSLGFKTYKSGKETAIRKKIWKMIGYIDLEKENIIYPDLVIFMPYDKVHFIERSRVMRDGNPYVAPREYYIELLKKGFIYDFFLDYMNFERWIMVDLENYPANESIFPLPEGYS